jgi:hypothetical protein
MGISYKKWWRIVAKALGEKAHHHNRIADQVALVRFCILLAYMTTNIFICAGVIRHWNG